MQDKTSDIADNKQSVSLNVDHQRHLVKTLRSSLIPKNILLMLMLIVLLSVLYFVVVWLPSSVAGSGVGESGIAPNSVAIDAKAFMSDKSSKPIDESPWQDAQLAKYRLAAQDILSKVLTKQKLLEDKKVSLWAKSSFEKALQQAASGDLFYRNQEFTTAIKTYQHALEQFSIIEMSIPTLFEERLTQGQAALRENDANVAKQQLQIAMYMQPNNEQAKVAFDRALVLDQVIALIKKGSVEQEEQQFALAKKSFKQAAELDIHSTQVKKHLSQVNVLIKKDNYSKAMSGGYQALLNKKYDIAVSFFKQALKITPESIDAKQAINQSHNEKTQTVLLKNIKQGQDFEQQEQWQPALTAYNQALSLDQSLIAAKVGVIRTKARLDFDNKLQNIIDKPERLMEETVFAQADQYYRSALKINNAGERLQQQITQIYLLLSQFETPLSLTVESDNQTEILLQRSGGLGRFIAKELTLKPGAYTFIGSRDGYRDVRQKVILVPDSDNNKVIIQCVERVGRG